MRAYAAAILCALIALPLGSSAQAATGDEVLAMMDAASSRATDQFFEYELINVEPGKEPKMMALSVHIKGDKRMTEFLAPGDMAGTKVLVRSRTELYIYLPAYNKVRRVASHATRGGFLGTTYSNEDISTITFGDIYSGKLLAETDRDWTVEATPRDGVGVMYGKLIFTIRKDYKQASQVQYFNARKEHIKTETRTEYSCQGDVCNAAIMTMVDHRSGDASTQFLRRDWQVNTGVSDSLFSKRNLQP
jgi:outer membrane lipoprotein-sorting protein